MSFFEVLHRFISAGDSTDWFCCIKFDAEPPAIQRLNPDSDLPDTRWMSGAPKPLVPKGHIEKFSIYLSE